MQDSIVIRGARVHNLQHLSVAIPHNQITVVTGVSGSGKSSLVFDTIYAEGQRRYVESLSAYARQFLDRMQKPAVDQIEGIAPPVAIRQKNTTRNPRSTVATATELYDYMRLLWARAGETWCPECGAAVMRDTVDQVAARVLGQPAGSRWYVLFPLRAGPTAEELRDRLFDLRKRGFNRLFQDGRTFEFSTPESLLEIDFRRGLFLLVDRLALTGSPELRQRIVDAVEICYREAGEAVVEAAAGDERLVFSERFACKRCGREFLEPEPNLFSFNSPAGACPRCQGFANVIDYDPERIIPDPYLTLAGGAVHPWSRPAYRHFLKAFLQRTRGSVRGGVAYAELAEEEKKTLWEAIQASFRKIETKKYKVHVRVFLSRYRGYAACTDCGGARLRPEALNVRFGGLTIAAAVRKNIAEALEFFTGVELAPEPAAIAGRVLEEIRQRLRFLHEVGLDYLTLDRLSATLSGGEAQRIQLATCLGSRLVGACYVLDEPSIGLHSRDTARLIRILEELRELGNTIIVVEHDADIMRAADHIIDLGPGAGENGGHVVFAGPRGELFEEGVATLTARYLRGEIATPRMAPRKPDARRRLRLEGCRAHNLDHINVEIPLDRIVAVTGVSGSGKSTLVHDVLYPALGGSRRTRFRGGGEGGEEEAPSRTWRGIEGAHLVKEVVLVDQSPIGRTPRSNPVTYIKVFDQIRELMAATREAARRGYAPGHFSFNIPGGRCETCQGDGTVTVEMQFLADVELVCDDCQGTRFKPGVLEVRYLGRNIHEILGLTVSEALGFFAGTPRLVARLRVLEQVGLGYLRLGQSATTLSGGEAQRVKLAAHLGQASVKGALFLFDEPTTGLHFDDVAKLVDAFRRLVAGGASVLIIEHNLEIIRNADWIIDLGPEGGASGGRVVACGTPDEVARVAESHTGRFLAAHC